MMAKDCRMPVGCDRSKTLEQLEGIERTELGLATPLVKEIHRLYAVPLERFSTENLRIMIGQQRGLPYLVPMALDILEADPWAAGDFYAGDLLHSVVRVASEFWKSHPELVDRLFFIFSELGIQRDLLETKLLPGWNRILHDTAPP
jgi:CDI immunity proteins